MTRWHPLTVLGVAGGALLCSAFVSSPASWAVVCAVAALATAAQLTAALHRDERRGVRLAGRVALVVTAAFHALWIYLALSWGVLLGWTTGWGTWLATAAAVGAWAVTLPRKHPAPRVPLSLALGVWSVACLVGWEREEGFLRCDDLHTALADGAVELVVATVTEPCPPGEVVSIARYPRFIWEDPGGQRLVFTTQSGGGREGGRFTGSVCEALASGADEPRCVGSGKAQGIADAMDHDRLYITAWGRFAPGVRGKLYALSRSAPLRIEAEVDAAKSIAEIFYDAGAQRLWCAPDEGFELLPYRTPSLEAEAPVPVAMLIPGTFRYDPEGDEGVVCATGGPWLTVGGEPYVALGARGEPLSLRALGGEVPLAWLSLSWGCDWDPSARRVYVSIPNLGRLAVLDYDSGAVIETHPVDIGARTVVVDPRRRRLYVVNFLRGEVVALDEASGEPLRRWQVGRFARGATLSRDGGSLWVGSNVGVVRIDLGD